MDEQLPTKQSFAGSIPVYDTNAFSTYTTQITTHRALICKAYILWLIGRKIAVGSIPTPSAKLS